MQNYRPEETGEKLLLTPAGDEGPFRSEHTTNHVQAAPLLVTQSGYKMNGTSQDVAEMTPCYASRWAASPHHTQGQHSSKSPVCSAKIATQKRPFSPRMPLCVDGTKLQQPGDANKLTLAIFPFSTTNKMRSPWAALSSSIKPDWGCRTAAAWFNALRPHFLPPKNRSQVQSTVRTHAISHVDVERASHDRSASTFQCLPVTVVVLSLLFSQMNSLQRQQSKDTFPRPLMEACAGSGMTC